MTDLPRYEDQLYYVWGFHGILVLDALSHTEALEFYANYFNCDVTMVEHVMIVPNIDEWAVRPEDPEMDPHHEGCDPDDCEECRIPCTYFPTTVVQPDDPRISWIDVKAEKTALDARTERTIAWSREHGGYWRGPDAVEMSQGPLDPSDNPNG